MVALRLKQHRRRGGGCGRRCVVFLKWLQKLQRRRAEAAAQMLLKWLQLKLRHRRSRWSLSPTLKVGFDNAAADVMNAEV